MGLSVESNDAYLLNKIEKAKRKIKLITDLAYPGFALEFVAGTLIFLSLTLSESLSSAMFVIMFFGGFLCASVLPISIIMLFPINHQILGYYRGLSTIPIELRAAHVCPNCKKDMPKDAADICIFCGYNQYNGKITYHYKGQPKTKL